MALISVANAEKYKVDLQVELNDLRGSAFPCSIIGGVVGRKLNVKKAVPAKEKILKYSRTSTELYQMLSV